MNKNELEGKLDDILKEIKEAYQEVERLEIREKAVELIQKNLLKAATNILVAIKRLK